jgi:hypothetical protein
MQSMLTFGLCLTLLAFSGCDKSDDNASGSSSSSASSSANSPSAGEIETAVKEAIDSESEKKVRVVSVAKTDGKQNDSMGLYIAYIDVELEVVEDLPWGIAKGTKDMPVSIKGNRESFNPVVKKGQILKLKGIQRMSKRESGWKSERTEGPSLWPTK